MKVTQDKVLTQMLFAVTAVSVYCSSAGFHQEFQQLREMILDWEFSRV